MKNLFAGFFALLLMAGVFAPKAMAIGVYADFPVDYTFSDCTGDCSESAAGMKAGVLWGNLGIGMTAINPHLGPGAKMDLGLLDISYLLPIPVINITGGFGFGTVGLDAFGNRNTGSASQVWASFGFPIIPLFDLHVAYHKTTAKVDVSGTEVDLSGSWLSVGTLLNF